MKLAGPRGRGLLAYLLYLLKLRSRRYDYVVGFWAQDNVLLALAFLFSRTRLILCEHQSHFFPPLHVRILRRLLYQTAWRVTVLNRAEHRHYARFLRNVLLVPNPVPARELDIARAEEKLVLGVGHLIPRKGFLDLAAAWARSGLAKAGWRLVIIGDGPQKSLLEAAIAKEGVLGLSLVAPSGDIWAWYARAAILAISSDVEVFSLVLAEAVAAGVVPVAYAADGPAYLLEDFPEQLVPIGDIDGLAAALQRTAARADRRTLAARIQVSVGRRASLYQVTEAWRRMIFASEGLEEKSSVSKPARPDPRCS